MARLLLGPLVRHIGETDATVWVELDGPGEVEVLEHRARTFEVEGHWYALVVLRNLVAGREYPYQVVVDGVVAWPEPGPEPEPEPEPEFPPCRLRTIDAERPFRLVFGSCRVAAPHVPPFTLPTDAHQQAFGPDALYALALRLRAQPSSRWPDALLLLGDQVYADEVSPQTLEFIRARRSTSEPPGEEIADFEEYTRLYRESWSDPAIRWLLANIPTTMLWDDHDVHDDWNISYAWLERMQTKPWWHERMVAAYMSYWLYQHLGNLSLEELDRDRLYADLVEATETGSRLRDYATAALHGPTGVRWSFVREFGRTRLLAIDCRAGRVLDQNNRSMLDEDEWRWVEDHGRADCDHLLLALSDPYLLAPGIHHLQAWNEAVCKGVWGRAWARIGERLRQALDLDHWASFHGSFQRLSALLETVGAGAHAPATIVALSGDVHNAYIAEATFAAKAKVESRVYQVVCSPFRNPLGRRERLAQRFAAGPVAARIGRALAAAACVPRPPLCWRYVDGPSFDNQLGVLELEGRCALVRLERAVGTNQQRLEVSHERRLS